MKALVYEGPETLGYRDVADPEAGAGHLVKIEAVGICGSDMHAYLGHDARRPAPLILGHEGAGTVIGGPRDGERVTINPLVTCGTCQYCTTGRENICPTREIISMPPREGAFAQYVTMPGENLITVPGGVDIAKAALAEPMAVSWHAARLGLEALHPGATKRALVLGGGTIGLCAALALRAMGVDDITIVEPNEARRAYLTAKGEHAVAEGTGQFALVFDCVGYAATRAAASGLAEPGGIILHIGLGDQGEAGFDARRATLQEITFIGTYTYTAQDFRDTAQAIYDGRLGALDWVEHRDLADGAGAFADLRAGRVAAPKIILNPWG